MYELIKKLCVAKGISPTKLCIEITGSKGNLPTWQKGNINPTSLIKIADYFEVSTDYLLGRTNEPNSIYSIIGDNNTQAINNNDNSQVTVTTGERVQIDKTTAELVELIQSLPLLKRAEAVLYLNSIKKDI